MGLETGYKEFATRTGQPLYKVDKVIRTFVTAPQFTLAQALSFYELAIRQTDRGSASELWVESDSFQGLELKVFEDDKRSGEVRAFLKRSCSICPPKGKHHLRYNPSVGDRLASSVHAYRFPSDEQPGYRGLEMSNSTGEAGITLEADTPEDLEAVWGAYCKVIRGDPVDLTSVVNLLNRRFER